MATRPQFAVCAFCQNYRRYIPFYYYVNSTLLRNNGKQKNVVCPLLFRKTAKGD